MTNEVTDIAQQNRMLKWQLSSPIMLGDVPSAQLRQWAVSGAETKLERAILSGQGHRLLAEAEALPLPQHLVQLVAKCDAVHAAVEKGSLLELKNLLDNDYNRNKCAACCDEAGVGLLHKAVFYNYMDIVQWLVKNYPQLVKQRDSEGRTALHYTAALGREEAAAAELLQRAGAARGARDAAGHTLAHYRAAPTLLALPAADMPRPNHNHPGLVIKRHNIRIWCHECDMGRLQRVIWEGHGTRLLSEVSSQPIVKRFLEAVPYIMNTIRDIHKSVIENDLEGLMKLTADPVPSHVLSSKDANGLTALHKAAGLGRCSILKYIIEKYPQGINDIDTDGRTPLHYAATVKDEQHTYNTLVDLGADESIVDNKGKSPAYYKNRPQEIDKNALKILPDAPRTPSSAYPASWDWKLLDIEHFTDINKKSRKKNLKASNENISSKNNTSTLSETYENHPIAMKNSSTHELINTLPELDDAEKQNINEHQNDEENMKTKETLEAVEEQDQNQGQEETDVNKEILKDTFANGTKDIQSTDTVIKPSENENEPIYTNNDQNQNDENSDLKNGTEHDNKHVSDIHIVNDNTEDDEDKNDAEVVTGSEEKHEDEISNKQSVEDHNEVNSENKDDDGNNNNDINNMEKDKQSKLNKEINPEDANDSNNESTFTITPEQRDDMDKKQEHFENFHTYNTPNGDNSDLTTGTYEQVQKESVASVKTESATNSDNSEDDDDVQVQEKTHSEPTDMILTHDTNDIDMSEKNNSKGGMQINGRNTQESLIEGIINGDAEQDSQDASISQKDGSVHGEILIVDNEIDPEVTNLINSANMEMLATLVLNGEGSRLIGRHSQNIELQSFLDNVPTYMQKINRVHIAAKEGNIRDLQTALDRRKFAIARDPISPNGATPLHVATVFGKTNIIKYLGGRFPETLSAVDFEGRTALHYAAVIPDNGHYYYLMQQLGANAKDLDDNGRSAEDYLKNPNLLPYEQLLNDYGISDDVAQKMLSDKVPEDQASSRRNLDTPEALDIIERCYRLLASAKPSRTPLSASSNKSTPPFVLGRFLKRSIFELIRFRITKLDHDLFDVVWPAVKKLPNNKNVIQTVEEDFPGGVAAPDYYVYEVFHEFLIPLIKDLHNINITMDLPIHPSSDFNSEESSSAFKPFDELNIDPSEEFVLSGTIECTRNLLNFELPINLKVGQLEKVERILTILLMNEKFSNLFQSLKESAEKGGTYYTLNEVLEKPSEISATLASNGLLVPLCDREEIDDCTRLHGKHWPYGRGVFVNDDKTIAIWINVHDHVRVLICTPSDCPGEIGVAYNKMSIIMSYLHDRLDFVWDRKLGHLSSRPTFLGAGIRFSLLVNFPELSKDTDNIKHLCAVRGLQYRETFNSEIARISNYQCLSITESVCFNDFATAISNLLHLEQELSMQNSAHISEMLTNIFKRKRNSLAESQGKNHALNGHLDIPVFHTDEGRYLAKSLGDPLIKGLTEVANVKPKDPVAFLASFLQNFPESEKPRMNTQESKVFVTSGAPEVENDVPAPQALLSPVQSPIKTRSAALTATRPHRPIEVIALDPQSTNSPDAPELAFSSVNRDEHGQSMLHFAAARTHANNALFQLLQESDVSLGYRDELYRTARDVSIQANVPENTLEIDKWVLHLAARGKSEKIMELLLQGYDHILDVVGAEGTTITDVVSTRGDTEMSNLLTSIPAFEESREALHSAVRRGDLNTVRDIVTAEGGSTLARAHNSFGRTALHVAVLAQHEDIVAYLAETCPELLRIGDNLERTPLHYAMGVEKIESLSRVLIRAGAKRVLKDLKGRQPSYYFMNKSDILRLKEEEEAY
ncbi:uncharacterized protein [Battus philenor]|uniref:uncharacterized protein n=1 Tax=Battus philenor TaxID=42288 RepID=UPI0035CFF73D